MWHETASPCICKGTFWDEDFTMKSSEDTSVPFTEWPSHLLIGNRRTLRIIEPTLVWNNYLSRQLGCERKMKIPLNILWDSKFMIHCTHVPKSFETQAWEVQGNMWMSAHVTVRSCHSRLRFKSAAIQNISCSITWLKWRNVCNNCDMNYSQEKSLSVTRDFNVKNT